MERRVVKWVSYMEAGAMPVSPLPSLGGRIVSGDRWVTYLQGISEEARPYAEALRASILERGLKCTGEVHQRHSRVPVFDDGTAARFTYRAWGDLMAAIWSEQEGIDYGYMDFYM